MFGISEERERESSQSIKKDSRQQNGARQQSCISSDTQIDRQSETERNPL